MATLNDVRREPLRSPRRPPSSTRRVAFVGLAAVALAAWLLLERLPPQPARPTVEASTRVARDPVPVASDTAAARKANGVVDDASPPGHPLGPYVRLLNSPDLLALYKELADSRDYVGLAVARLILAECLQVSAYNNLYRNIANGSMDHIGILPTVNDAQRAAARTLVSRCSGFNGWQPVAFKSEGRIIELKEAALTDTDAVVLQATAHGEIPSDSVLRLALAEQDPFVLYCLQGVLLSRWSAASGVSPTSGESDLANVGLSLAQCVLGSDCSDDSLPAVSGCLFRAASCGLGVDQQLDQFVRPEDAAKVADYRDRFTDAIRNGQLSIFGL